MGTCTRKTREIINILHSNKDDVTKAREGSGAVQTWNDQNASYNNGTGGSSGFVNDHYIRRGDSLLGMFATNKEIQNSSIGGASFWGVYKVGPEILNGGNFSISSGDHIMIKKIKWHGNEKTLSETISIYDDRDFIATGGSAISQVDITPYINNASINNISPPPELVLQAAAGNITCQLRDSFTKAEISG